MITISNGNQKLGKIPNLSLVPVKDCANCTACRKDCYALKAWRLYPSVRRAWGANSKSFRRDSAKACREVSAWIAKHKPRFFRWHVAGDILDQAHLDGIANVAKEHPQTLFLCFTKRHDLSFHSIPGNLSIVLSMFPSMPMPSQSLPIAWMQDGTETRIPANAMECPGHCDRCGMCWNLSTLGRDVFFRKH
jgi:ferredoxin